MAMMGMGRVGLGRALGMMRVSSVVMGVRRLASLPSHQMLEMPKLSPTMETGSIVKWNKVEGEEVVAGDTLAEVETDKATVDFDTTEDGYVAKILVPSGATDVAIGTPICIIVDDESNVAAFKSFTPNGLEAASAAAPAESVPDPVPQAPAAAQPDPPAAAVAAVAPTFAAPGDVPTRTFASFRARALAAEHGVDLRQVAGTGLFGSITAGDVQGYMSSGAFVAGVTAAPAAAAKEAIGAPKTTDRPEMGYLEVEVSPIRQLAAARAVESKATVPHFYLHAVCNVDRLMALMQQWEAELKTPVRLRDVVFKACACAAEKEPTLKGIFAGDHIKQLKSVEIALEVLTPQGPVLPVLRNVSSKGIASIASELAALEEKAKTGSLDAAELVGGTMTITDLSYTGVKSAAPLVVNGQGGAITIGALGQRVTKGSSGELEVSKSLTVSVSCDHRFVDGAVGAVWLKALKQFLENPASMLL